MIDPLAEDNCRWFAYMHCNNNPVLVVNLDGRDGVVFGTGTQNDPYVITANYYHYNLNQEQADALNGAIAQYNKQWRKRI